MTPDEKRDRRKARHELQAAFHKLVKSPQRIGLFATNRQLDDAAKTIADRYYAEQIRPAAARIEAQLVAEAQQKAQVS